MWLRNFDLACASTQIAGSIPLPSAAGAVAGEDGYNMLRQRTGTWVPPKMYSSGSRYLPADLYYRGYMQSMAASSTSGGFCFGTGMTPVTYDDYNLEHYLDKTFTYATSTEAVTYDENKKTFIRTLTSDFLNSSGADVTVSEIGNGGWFAISSVGNFASFLLLREVLSTPVTVAAGEYIRVTLSYEVGAYPSKPTVTASTT